MSKYQRSLNYLKIKLKIILDGELDFLTAGSLNILQELVDNSLPVDLIIDHYKVAQEIVDVKKGFDQGLFWGKSEERKELLKANGYNYELIQRLVNEIIESMDRGDHWCLK